MKYYTLEMLKTIYREEYSELPANEIHDKAKRLHTQLNTLDIYWKRSNHRFYDNVDLYGGIQDREARYRD